MLKFHNNIHIMQANRNACFKCDFCEGVPLLIPFMWTSLAFDLINRWGCVTARAGNGVALNSGRPICWSSGVQNDAPCRLRHCVSTATAPSLLICFSSSSQVIGDPLRIRLRYFLDLRLKDFVISAFNDTIYECILMQVVNNYSF
jgi:hypothetical protein